MMRMSWYRLRASIRDSPKGVITLGFMYGLVQECVLGLSIEEMSSLLADAMGSKSVEAEAQNAESPAFDDVIVQVSVALPAVEKYIQKQWDKVCTAVSDMSKSLPLAEIHTHFMKHGLNFTLEQLCLLPEWETKMSKSGMLSSRSERILGTSRRGVSDRVDSMLRSKIKVSCSVT